MRFVRCRQDAPSARSDVISPTKIIWSEDVTMGAPTLRQEHISKVGDAGGGVMQSLEITVRFLDMETPSSHHQKDT